jgi:hypothetical protein
MGAHRVSRRCHSNSARSPCDYSSNSAGTRPDRKRTTGTSSKSPSSASPVRDHAITPTLVSASRSAVRQAVCADLHATAGSGRRRVPRPARNDCTMNSVSWAMERILKNAVYTLDCTLPMAKSVFGKNDCMECKKPWWISGRTRTQQSREWSIRRCEADMKAGAGLVVFGRPKNLGRDRFEFYHPRSQSSRKVHVRVLAARTRKVSGPRMFRNQGEFVRHFKGHFSK